MGFTKKKRRKPETLYNLEVETRKLPEFAYCKETRHPNSWMPLRQSIHTRETIHTAGCLHNMILCSKEFNLTRRLPWPLQGNLCLAVVLELAT